MTHAFQAIGSTATGAEIVLAVFPVTGDAQSAYDQAEARCERHRSKRNAYPVAYAYVREVGFEETREERQERAASEQARLAELIAADPYRDVPTLKAREE